MTYTQADLDAAVAKERDRLLKWVADRDLKLADRKAVAAAIREVKA